VPLSPLLAGYRNVILDLDGSVYVGDRPVPGAPEAIAALRTAGLGVAFVTNDGRRSPEEYVRKLWRLGIQASLEEVVSAGAALQFALAQLEPGTGAFVIGSPAVLRHVSGAGLRILNGTPRAERAEIVVVSGHDGFDYAQLRTATRAALAGAQLIATGRDRTFPSADGPCPGTGTLVAALEYASGRVVRSVGKPSREMFDAALDRLGPGRTLVIGDRLDSDLAGAAAAGLDGAIVLTGSTSREQAAAAVRGKLGEVAAGGEPGEPGEPVTRGEPGEPPARGEPGGPATRGEPGGPAARGEPGDGLPAPRAVAENLHALILGSP
jgi:HAD superfamily hydrolase (TIGR01450 family)